MISNNMTKKNLPNKNKSQRSRSKRDPIRWRYCLLTFVCGIVLVTGFFFAAQQHFSSIDFSIKNSRLRKQIEELEAGKRRLILAKEIALSPAEIKKAAQKIGFREMTASNIEVYRPNAAPAEITPGKTAEKLKIEKPFEEKSKPVTSTKPEEKKKPVKEIKVEKKPQIERERIDKSKPQAATK